MEFSHLHISSDGPRAVGTYLFIWLAGGLTPACMVTWWGAFQSRRLEGGGTNLFDIRIIISVQLIKQEVVSFSE